MNKRSNSVIKTVPAATALHSVPMFDPLKLLRMTTSAKTGEKVLRLDLSYKKMWFLLVHPRGRMLTNILRVTDQMAIFEAQLYADRGDNTVLAQFTSCHTRKESGPQYIRNAQDEALNEALDNAGFGIQFCDVSRDYGGELFGSEVPVQTETAEAAAEETEEPIVEETIAETAPTMDMDSASAEQHVVETTAPVMEETPDLHVVPPQQEEAAEEVAEQPQAASYTADMDVSEITQRMTVDEAKTVVVQIGTCRGWTLEQVAQRRPASLKWYLYGCDQADNILKAAASVLLDNLQQKAG